MHREWASSLVPGVLWERTAKDGEIPPGRVLPDGCMDVIWTGEELLVAGPDRRARLSGAMPGPAVVGLRFHPGVAPGVLGLPADVLTDRTVSLADLWPSGEVRRLTEQVALAPAAAPILEELALQRLHRAPAPDPLVPAIVRAALSGLPIAPIAAQTGVGERPRAPGALPVAEWSCRR